MTIIIKIQLLTSVLASSSTCGSPSNGSFSSFSFPSPVGLGGTFFDRQNAYQGTCCGCAFAASCGLTTFTLPVPAICVVAPLCKRKMGVNILLARRKYVAQELNTYSTELGLLFWWHAQPDVIVVVGIGIFVVIVGIWLPIVYIKYLELPK